ncbi:MULTISPECIES: DUF2842 domain-containing protein [unclassified Caulobacter]|uniref:DUF2842 domain-containing protein n=1 Tax=Caulobacter sp. 17J65-9 TaxID=2709382 RepID=UPI0013CD8910|nr:DUF2842 domain-containing protein [Caulobacter sp. 17J80-11]NEX92090.1 DUF2842 domain-containing protein [Caulobacter sp. 17J65-9]
MGARARRAVAAVGVLAFLGFYIWAAATLADRLPDVRWVQLIYFVVVGTAWGVPIMPLLWWAERGDRPRR